MKRLAGLTALALLTATSSGCGWLWGDDGYFRDRGSDYLTARESTPMQLPPDVQARRIESLLPVPAAIPTPAAGGKFELPRPQALGSTALRELEQGGSVSLLDDRRFDAPAQVSLSSDGSGNPLLTLASDFDRAWSAVGRALQDADVRVDDLDRSLGVYYINLAEGAEQPDAEPGFFSRLLGRDKAESIDARAERYQLRLTPVGSSVQVSVEQGADTLAPADVARRILVLIQDRLG